MALINITLPTGEVAVQGKQVTFIAPCSSDDCNGLLLDNDKYSLVDAGGFKVEGIANVWEANATVSVILDPSLKLAYVQNPISAKYRIYGETTNRTSDEPTYGIDASKEETIVFRRKDKNGNTVVQMPITKAENIEDLSTTGVSAYAKKLQTASNISLSGDATGSTTFDGSTDKDIKVTLSNSGVTAGSYGVSSNATPTYGATFNVPYITVDAKGRITGASNKTVKIPDKITVDSAMSSTSTNPVQNKVVDSALSAKAPLASPALTGTPTAPTASAGTNTTQIATTAFVTNAVSSAKVMTGATSSTAGTQGYVPAPKAGEQNKFLCGDGSFKEAGNVKSVNGQTGDVVIDIFPVGAILPFSGGAVPTGYLTCNGAAVSRTTYADLFAVIGTTYGVGNGSTTFNLPNLNNGSFLEGSNTAGTVKSAGLPNITGDFSYVGYYDDNTDNTGSFVIRTSALYSSVIGGSTASFFGNTMHFNANLSNSVYGNSDTVQPKSVTVKYCIKY